MLVTTQNTAGLFAGDLFSTVQLNVSWRNNSPQSFRFPESTELDRPEAGQKDRKAHALLLKTRCKKFEIFLCA